MLKNEYLENDMLVMLTKFEKAFTVAKPITILFVNRLDFQAHFLKGEDD